MKIIGFAILMLVLFAASVIGNRVWAQQLPAPVQTPIVVTPPPYNPMPINVAVIQPAPLLVPNNYLIFGK
jgi:hypothetical protein